MSTKNVTVSLLDRQGVDCKAYENMGCHAVVRPSETDGEREVFRFRVWAPRATAVFVTGDFNSWGNSAPMHRIADSDVWETEIDRRAFASGCLYKYRILTPNGEFLRADPYAVSFEMPPATAARAEPLPGYLWRDGGWLRYRAGRKENGFGSPLNVYEVHLGSWKRRDDGSVFTYTSIASELACYVKQMGYTHVKLLPVTEHSSYDSLGYGVSGYYAPTARYGTPGEFMYFVDTMHEAGVGVILDWVATRFSRDAQSLYEFDGEPLYETEATNDVTRRFDTSRREVLSFLLSNLSFWVEQYHVDGFCLCDIGDHDGELLDMICAHARENYADVLMLSERENDGFLCVEKASSQSLLSYVALDSACRKYHPDMPQIRGGACGEQTVSAVFRRPVDGDVFDAIPGDAWQRFATVRAAYGYLMSCAGKALLFMGNEIGQPERWRHRGQVDWSLLEKNDHARLQLFFASMNHFYLTHSALWGEVPQSEVDRTRTEDREKSILVCCRTASDGDGLFIVTNFTPNVYREYELAVPAAGEYEEIFNSDDLSFGGSGVKNDAPLAAENANDPKIRITVPPLAVCIFRQKKTARPKTHPLCFPMTQYK